MPSRSPAAPKDLPAADPPLGDPPYPEDLDFPPALLDRLGQGDPEALDAVFDRYGDRVYNLCRRITGCEADAEDATQDVFLRVFEQIQKFDRRSRFGTWLFRLTVNQTLNLLRRNRRRSWLRTGEVEESQQPVDEAPRPLESVLRREERDLLDAALCRMPVDQRTILVLREIEGLSYAEIAAVLELPVGTVNSRIVRSRERLAELLRRTDSPDPMDGSGGR